MKSIKTTFIRGLSLLLALVIMLSLPVSAFASTPATPGCGIDAYTYTYDAQRTRMMNHSAFRALKYLGYDRYENMGNAGTLFELTRNEVAAEDRTSITYSESTGTKGRETAKSNVGYLDVTSATGYYPHVRVFENGLGSASHTGLDCADYVEYYLYNYLPNIEGADISILKDIVSKSSVTLDDVRFWPLNRDAMIQAGVRVWSVAVDDFDETYYTDTDGATMEVKHISKYTDPDGNVKSSDEYDIYEELPIGSVIQMGNSELETVHYAIYAGTYNGKHYIYHCGNVRGPEIACVEDGWTYNDKDAKSLPLYFYSFSFATGEEDFGSIEVYKDDENGKPLAGARFRVDYEDGTSVYITTDETGYARLKDLLLGTYTITEVAAPEGYEKVDTVWTVKLTQIDPTGGGTIHVTNTRLLGSLKIIKDILPESAAIPDNLAGWQFNVYKNDPTYTTTIRDGVIYRVKVTDTAGNTFYSEDATLTVEEQEELPPIVITAQPENNAAAVGGQAPFTVEAYSTLGKTLTYQWYYIRVTDTSWNVSSVGKGPTYTVEMYDSSYEYRRVKCLISDGTNQIWSDEADLYLPTSLGVKKNPADAKAAYGASAVFSITCYNTPTSYTWQYSADGSTWTNCSASSPFTCSGYNTASLKVTSSEEIDGYQFRCVISDGSDTVTSKAGTLTAVPPYSFTSSPSYALVEIGSSQSFYFGVAGGDLTYQWQIQTSADGEWIDIEGATSSGMTLTMTEAYSNSKVRAVATQGDYVLYSAPISFATPDTACILTQPESVIGEAGEEVTLSVTTNGGGLVYEWEVSTDGGTTWTAVTDTLVGTYTTGEAGTIQIDELPTGDYFVQEIDTGKDGWEYDLTPKAVTVTENNTAQAPAEVHFTNSQSTGSITVTKKILPEGSGGNVAGWIVDLYMVNDDGTTTYRTSGTTGEDGTYTFTDLEAGRYIVKESDQNNRPGYTLDTTEYGVDVLSGVDTPVTITNTQLGSGKIVKDTTNGGTKAGWQFKVWTDAAELGIFTTDDNGEIDLGQVAPCTVYIQEIGHISMTAEELSYWIMDTEVKTLVIEAGETKSVSFNNQWFGKGQINKDTTNSGTKAGWQFKVWTDAAELGIFTTDENGDIDLGQIAPCTVYIQEIGHISMTAEELSYWIMDTKVKELEIVAGETKSVSFNNQWFGKGQINKDTTNSGTKAGWQFKVWTDAAELGIFTTDDNGGIDLGLLAPGTIYIQEIGHKDMTADQLAYWSMDTSAQTLVIEAGKTSSASFTNCWLGKGQISKSMADGSSPVGYQFEVICPDGKPLSGSPFTITDENGVFFLGDLEPGEYIVREIIPEGSIYLPVGGAEKTLTVVAGETCTVSYVNALRSGEITVNKVDGSDTDKTLAGAKFLLEWLDNDVWAPVVYSDTVIPGGCASIGLENGCLTTGEDGQIIFYGLHPGCEYRLREVQAPNGYLLQARSVFEGKLPVDTLSFSRQVPNTKTFTYPASGSFEISNLALASGCMMLLAILMATVILPCRIRNFRIQRTKR